MKEVRLIQDRIWLAILLKRSRNFAFREMLNIFRMVDLSDLQKGACFMEFKRFKELMNFTAQIGHMCTFQLLGMYPCRTNKLFVLLI